MKVQEIHKDKYIYYQVYLPKNILETVLAWDSGESLSYEVKNDSLILRNSSKLNKNIFLNFLWLRKSAQFFRFLKFFH